MKKLFLFLLIALTGMPFYSCKKIEEQQILSQTTNENSDEKSGLGFDIDELIAKTGIDIYALSELPVIQSLSFDINNVVVSGNISSVRATITPALVTQLNTLKNAMEVADANGDYDTFQNLFGQFCSITNSISEISFIEEQGFQLVQYNENNVHGLEANAALANATLTAVTESYPVFSTLPENTQREVLTAAIYLNVEKSIILTREMLSCEKSAKANLVIALSAAEAAYLYAATICLGTAVAVLICEGVAFVAFVYASVSAINTYKLAMASCK